MIDGSKSYRACLHEMEYWKLRVLLSSRIMKVSFLLTFIPPRNLRFAVMTTTAVSWLHGVFKTLSLVSVVSHGVLKARVSTLFNQLEGGVKVTLVND